jgi:hypothetical protein
MTVSHVCLSVWLKVIRRNRGHRGHIVCGLEPPAQALLALLVGSVSGGHAVGIAEPYRSMPLNGTYMFIALQGKSIKTVMLLFAYGDPSHLCQY